MNHQTPKRPRVAMLSSEDALRVLRAKWPEDMTAREVYFAARPPLTELDRSVSGSAYAKKAIDALVERGDVVLVESDGSRSARFRVSRMPGANSGLEGIEAREVAHGTGVKEPSASSKPAGAEDGTSHARGPDPIAAPVAVPAGIVEVAGPSKGSAKAGQRTASTAGDDPDPIATILLGMARAPRIGSRIDIVKNQAAEGIAWARAAGWTDHRIAQEIVEASQLDARPEEIIHLVAAVPGRSPSSGRTAQAR